MISEDTFKTIKSLGIGATAEVFWAVNLKTDRNVALKVFNPIVYQDAEAMARLKLEVESLEKLKHPNVVTLIAEHVREKFYALELELVEGSDLRVWQKNNESKLIEDRLWVLAQVARGLGAAHELEILHRDLKPENIMISDSGEVKIADFGLARQLDRLTMTRIGLLTGSLGYMAPEIINGQKATSKSDIFSFGVIAYELLAGASPFSGETPQALLKSVVEKKEISLKEKNPLVPARVAKFIESSLEKDPSKRPESIWLLEGEILSYLSSTRLLPLCRDFIKQSSRSERITEALSLKYKTLYGEIERLQKLKTQEAKTRLIEIAQELMILFPEDERPLKILKTLTENKPAKARPFIVLAVIICLVIFSGFFFWKKNQRIDFAKSPSVALTEVKKPQETESPVAVENSEAALFRGTVRFIADKDVNIYVDRQRVPKKNWLSFKVVAGSHIIKLVKPGFMPIENQIEVLAGKTITINANGEE